MNDPCEEIIEIRGQLSYLKWYVKHVHEKPDLVRRIKDLEARMKQLKEQARKSA